MVKVKICGITKLEDAAAAAEAGADALGFVFYKKSPRYIAPERASRLIRQLPAHIIKIGVFVNAKEKVIRRIAKICRLDMLQFHGGESPEFCAKFRKNKIIKAFSIKGRIDLRDITRYRTFAYLFDTFVRTKIGGTGKKFNWKLLTGIDGLKLPIFLSGGLNAGNVKAALRAVHPDWLDVSSSVEVRPGKKDIRKVKKFIEAAKK